MKIKCLNNSIFITLFINCSILNSMQVDTQKETPNFIKQHLAPDSLNNKYAFDLPSEVGNIIARHAIRNSALFVWLLKQIEFPKRNLANLIDFAHVTSSSLIENFDLIDAESDKLAWVIGPKIIIFDTNTGQILAETFHKNYAIEDLKGNINSLAFNKKSNVLAAGYSDETLIWNMETGKCTQILEEHTDAIHSVTFNNQGTQLLTTSLNGTARLWDIQSGKLLKTFQDDRFECLTAVFSNNNDKILTTSKDNLVIWNAINGTPIQLIKRTSKFLFSPAFINHQESIALIANGNLGTVIDISAAKCIMHLEGHSDSICCASFNTKINKILTCSRDKTIKIWDYDSGSILCTLKNPNKSCHVQAIFYNDEIVTVQQNQLIAIDISIMEYLEKKLSLEQILLLYYIYETELINRRNLLLNGKAERIYFDLDKYTYLKAIYASLPQILKKGLYKYTQPKYKIILNNIFNFSAIANIFDAQ